MNESERKTDSLRWVLDHQKSDYDEIQSQVTKYFAIAASVIVAAGVAYIRGYWTFVDDSLPKTLAQDGLLWQNSILPPKSSPIFAEPLGMFSSIAGGFGIGLVVASLLIVVSIAKSPRCVPMGNASMFIDGNHDEADKWVRQNDELIDSLNQRRILAINLCLNGTTLLMLAAIIRFFSTKMVFIALLMVLYTILWMNKIYESNRLPKRDWASKMLTSMFIMTAILGPFGSYQDAYGYLPIEVRIVLIAVFLAILAYYFKSEIVHIADIARQRAVARLDDST